jgi:patatin-like phospholipase/acyl hydrolase
MKQSGGTTEAPYLFRAYDHDRAMTSLVRNPGGAQDVPITGVARATSAAPTYFKTMKIHGQGFQDGGFGANNPSQLAFVEVKDMKMH